MRQAADYPALRSEMDLKFRKGVVTNFTGSPSVIENEISRGLVCYEATPSNLFIVRQRNNRYYLNFYINDTAEELPALPGNTVTEIVFREDDFDRQKVVSYLRKQGMKLQFFRKYLTSEGELPFKPVRKHTELPGDLELREACEGDLQKVTEALYDNFDEMTACLPSPEEISGALADRDSSDRYYLLETGGTAAGVLHTDHRKNSFEIRHLAVYGEFRGKGFSSFILDRISELYPGKNNVWVNYSNIPAKSLYANHGYTDTGRKSAVLLYKETGR